MKTIAQCTGKWLCTYNLIENRVGVEPIALIFDDGRVAGTGENDHGTFVISGYYNEDILVLKKEYITTTEDERSGLIIMTCSGRHERMSGVSYFFNAPWKSVTFSMKFISSETDIEQKVSEFSVGPAEPMTLGEEISWRMQEGINE